MSTPEAPQVSIPLDVPFHDVDMLEVAWHGHYYKYFENARTALFRKYGLDVPVLRSMGYAMVITDSRCRYLRPLRYGTAYTISARMVELEFRMKIEYVITDRDGGVMSRGVTTQVTLDPAKGEMYFNTPDDIVNQFGGLFEHLEKEGSNP